MASMANIDLDSFYTYSEAEKFIDKQVGSATGKQYTSLQKQTPRLINQAALNTLQWGQQTGTKSANRLKLYFQGQLANLLVQSGYSTKKPDNSLFTNQNTQTGGTGIPATGGSFYSSQPQMNPSGGKGQTPGKP